jgi:hypothetical protein
MQTVHRLESYKPQIDWPAFFYSVFRNLQDLCYLWFCSIFNILEIYCVTIDQQFDQLGPFLWLNSVQDNASDPDSLIELVM